VLGALFLLGSAAFVPLVLGGSDTSDDPSGSSAAQMAFVLCYGVLLLQSWRRPTARRSRLFVDPIMILLVGLAGTSLMWSLDPGVTARRTTGLLLTLAIGTVIPRLMSLHDLLAVLAAVCAMISVSSLVYLVALPGLASDPVTPSALRGVFTTKNELGRFEAFSVVVLLLYAMRAPASRRRLAMAGIALAVVELALSHSATGLIVSALIVPLALTFEDFRRRRLEVLKWLLPTSVLVATAGLAAFTLLELAGITRLVGRSDTLTGRVELWQLVIQTAQHKPWLGYGYQAFWVTAGGPADAIRQLLPFDVPHAHNGFLDLWLELGLAGVLLMVLYLVTSCFRSWRAMMTGSEAGLVSLTLISFLVMSNLTESNLLRANSCYLLTIFAALAFVGAPRRRGERFR
jgi:exopolysaccharide production protein ExoQ